MPWHVDNDPSYGAPWSSFPQLVIYFCDQGMLGGREVLIRDALVPAENDVLEWDSDFTRIYLRFGMRRHGLEQRFSE